PPVGASGRGAGARGAATAHLCAHDANMKTIIPRHLLRGLSLIELMVALTIGSLLIIGAVTVYVQSRSTYRINETVSRMQENARYAMSLLEPDIRLANHWGLMSDPLMITGTVGNAHIA